MSIKKRLIGSHLLMVMVPFLTMLVIGGAGLMIAKKLLLVDISGMTSMNKEFSTIQDILEEYKGTDLLTDNQVQSQMMERMSERGFKTCVWLNDEIHLTNMSEKEQKFLRKFLLEVQQNNPEHRLWVSNMDIRMVEEGYQVGNQNVVISVASIGELALLRAIEPEMLTGVGLIVLLAVLVTIGVVVFASLHLSARMTLDIVSSMNNLSAAAERIKNGDLDTDVLAGKDEELGKVCESFNNMQHQLKDNIEKNAHFEKVRKEMLAGISHDLRTPLTSIKSYIKGLQDGIATSEEKQNEYLSVAYRKSCDMESLIDQLFLLSKLETGSQPFHFRPVEIQKFMSTVLDTLVYDVERQKGTLTFQSDCSFEKVMMDGSQMQRVVTNIIQNSIKYGRGQEDRLLIDVSLYREEGSVVIQIQDHGEGVPETQLSRIFDSFYRADEARSNPERGSGLGLSIAKQIVEAHCGTIQAQNNGGLVFLIKLPCVSEI
jgi:signal transduction histidine kinase